jgi:hypothetical protein
MTYSDRADVKRIVEQSKQSDFKLASVIESLVTSELFRKR